jgi:hypothetical protein
MKMAGDVVEVVHVADTLIAVDAGRRGMRCVVTVGFHTWSKGCFLETEIGGVVSHVAYSFGPS